CLLLMFLALSCFLFFFLDTPPSDTSSLSLHDALPISMNADSGVPLSELKVDGGMIANETLMKFQADILGVDVVRPKVAETTALGAAYAAGIAVGFWSGQEDVVANWTEDTRWRPELAEEERERLYRNWKKAVTKTFDWVDEDTQA